MDSFLIDSRELYDYAVGRGYQPLIDPRFPMEHGLRLHVQRRMFGTGHTPAENDRFYRWCWDHLPHRCEECMRPLYGYSAVHISHILTKGAHPETAFDPRNVNILCLHHHNAWENGDRKGMRIYRRNAQTIEQLLREYDYADR